MDIGFICDIRENDSPRKVVGYSRRMRVFPLAKFLRDKGAQLFIYSRNHINPETAMASGYYLTEDRFLPVARPVPKVNGYWYLGNCYCPNRSGFTRQRFLRWAKEHHKEIYPDQKFGSLLTDKYSTFKLLCDSPLNVHPYTEIYDGSAQQIETFLANNTKLFIKKSCGSNGEKIFVLNFKENAIDMAYYEHKEIQEFALHGAIEAADKINEMIGDKQYIIQQGINVMRVKDRPFMVRAILIHDGLCWHWSPKVTISPKGGDVVNTTQGASNHTVEEIFNQIYDKDQSITLRHKLKNITFQLADYFDHLYPKRIMEFAVDFVVEPSGNFYVVESDVSPSMNRAGMNLDCPFADFFNITTEEQKLYDKYLEPHGRYLGEFLLSKLG